MQTLTGTIYLIHFDEPYQHAKHYTGWTGDLDQRITEHRHSRGSRLLQVVNSAGIGWDVVRTWTGTRKDERRLKNRGGASRICPVCRELGQNIPATAQGG